MALNDPVDPVDPVRERRAHIAHLTAIGKRAGYTLLLVAIVLFLVGFFAGYTGPLVSAIVASIAISSVVLAPSIVFGYGVKAAEREDRERGM